MQEPMQLENRIGLFWLNRLGIGALVFGFAFLMMYSIQQLGPLLKIAIGLVVAFGLVVGGELMGKQESRRWFGHGLAAGGWSLAYFVTYAAYYIEPARIIFSLPVETILLSSVAVGSLGWAVRARSEPLAILSIALAGVSILFSEPSLVADSSFLILAVLASFLGYRHGWKMLFAFAVGVCFMGHYYCSQALLRNMPAAASSDAVLSAIFIALIWLSFSIGLGYCTRLNQAKNTFVITLSYVNAALFAYGLSTFGSNLSDNIVETILAASGAVYMGMARWLYKRDCQSLANVHFLLALSLLNAAKSMRFSGMEMLSLDVMQIWLLMVLGIKNNISAFKYFAYGLVAFFTSQWLWQSSNSMEQVQWGFRFFQYDKLALVAVITFAHVTFFARKHLSAAPDPSIDFDCAMEPDAGDGAPVKRPENYHEKAFFMIANLTYLLVANHLVSSANFCLALSMQTALCLYFGLKLKDQFYASIGVFSFIGCAIATYLHYTLWSSLATGLEVAIFYALYLYEHMQRKNHGTSFESDCISKIAPHAATILLTALLYKEVTGMYLTLSLGIEGLALMTAAFVLKEKTFRTYAFSVIAIMLTKLLFFDLAHRGTLERIVSFIGAGVTLLLSSYVYALGTHAFKSVGAEPTFGDEMKGENVDNGDETEESGNTLLVHEFSQ